MSNHLNKVFFFMLLLALLFPIMASAQTMTNIPITEISPWAVGVNPVTSKVYVANHYRWVTVINGTTPIPVQLGMGGRAVGVNPVTNKIYIANQSSDNVTVIDDASNTSTTVQDKDPTTPAKAPCSAFFARRVPGSGLRLNPVRRQNRVCVWICQG